MDSCQLSSVASKYGFSPRHPRPDAFWILRTAAGSHWVWLRSDVVSPMGYGSGRPIPVSPICVSFRGKRACRIPRWVAMRWLLLAAARECGQSGTGLCVETSDYIAVLDAGSTGTRAHVFHYPPRISAAGKFNWHQNAPLTLPQEFFARKVRPGISSYSTDPSKLAGVLGPAREQRNLERKARKERARPGVRSGYLSLRSNRGKFVLPVHRDWRSAGWLGSCPASASRMLGTAAATMVLAT